MNILDNIHSSIAFYYRFGMMQWGIFILFFSDYKNIVRNLFLYSPLFSSQQKNALHVFFYEFQQKGSHSPSRKCPSAHTSFDWRSRLEKNCFIFHIHQNLLRLIITCLGDHRIIWTVFGWHQEKGRNTKKNLVRLLSEEFGFYKAMDVMLMTESIFHL